MQAVYIHIHLHLALKSQRDILNCQNSILAPRLEGKALESLLQLIEQRAIKVGYIHLYIISYHQFGNAVAMYEKYGYEYISSTLDQSGLYQDAPFYMLKEL